MSLGSSVCGNDRVHHLGRSVDVPESRGDFLDDRHRSVLVVHGGASGKQGLDELQEDVG